MKEYNDDGSPEEIKRGRTTTDDLQKDGTVVYECNGHQKVAQVVMEDDGFTLITDHPDAEDHPEFADVDEEAAEYLYRRLDERYGEQPDHE